jgi:hypothetical protein
MAVSKRTRYEVLRRDNHACRYCGGSAPDVRLTVDHVLPVALGGSDDPSNLVAACIDCNAGKSSTVPDAEVVANVEADAARWAAAIAQAAQVLEERDRPRNEYIGEFFAEWPSYRKLPNDAEMSVGRLFDAGLPVESMKDAILWAVTNRGVHDRFAYFMGICLKRVRELQDTAQEILASEKTSK